MCDVSTPLEKSTFEERNISSNFLTLWLISDYSDGITLIVQHAHQHRSDMQMQSFDILSIYNIRVLAELATIVHSNQKLCQ